MRRHAVLAFLLIPSLAAAEQTGGSGSNGGGRLGQVSGGMHGGGGGGGGGSGTGGGRRGDSSDPRLDSSLRDSLVDKRQVIVATSGGAVVAVSTPPKKPRYDGGPAKLEVYVGAQKVHESDGSWTAEVAIKDGLFRLGGSITRYYEAQPGTQALTLTVPSLIGGVRVDDGGPTKVYLEIGAVGAKTSHDPVMDSSVAGGIGGVRVEHRVSKSGFVTAELHEMIFEDDLRAHSARVGIKVGIVQASFRVLDLNVGPALYGPEFGLRF